MRSGALTIRGKVFMCCTTMNILGTVPCLICLLSERRHVMRTPLFRWCTLLFALLIGPVTALGVAESEPPAETGDVAGRAFPLGT